MSESWIHGYEMLNGVRLHFVRQGEGPAILLIHGWPGFWYEWHLNIPVLARQHTVIAPDLRGFAYSDKPDLPAEEGYTAEAAAGDLLGLLDRLGLRRVGVVAHDIGARVAQALTRADPARVARLVLFDPPYPGIGARWMEPGHVREIWYQTFHLLDWAPGLVGASRKTTELYLRHFLSHWSYDKRLFTDAEVAEYVEAYSQPRALWGGFQYYRARARQEKTWAGLPVPALQVPVPTLVLWGENDPVLPVRWADRLPEYFPHLTFRTVPACGHFMMREQPDLVHREVLGFFRDLGQG
jgi:pimeloyl-ACP methyl ester carboxylesterase